MSAVGLTPVVPPLKPMQQGEAGPQQPQRPPLDFSSKGMQANTAYRKTMNTLITVLAIAATVLVVTPLLLILAICFTRVRAR